MDEKIEKILTEMLKFGTEKNIEKLGVDEVNTTLIEMGRELPDYFVGKTGVVGADNKDDFTAGINDLFGELMDKKIFSVGEMWLILRLIDAILIDYHNYLKNEVDNFSEEFEKLGK